MRETTEEQLLLQNEAKGLTGVKDTEHAYHKIEKKHQLVQTTLEEFPPEHEMAEQEMHDEATGKKLVCETGMHVHLFTFLFIITIIYTVHTQCVFTVSVLSPILPILQAS